MERKTGPGKQLLQRKEPTQARGRRIIGEILEATHRVLQRAGPAGITTPGIAVEAGVSVGAIYHYFPNKESIILSLYQAKLADIRSVVERPIEPIEGDWRAGLRDWYQAIKSHEAAIGFDVAMNEAMDHFPSLKEVSREHASNQARTIAGHLRRLGSDWPDDDLLDVALQAYFLNSSLWLYWAHKGQPQAGSIERFADALAALVAPALEQRRSAEKSLSAHA